MFTLFIGLFDLLLGLVLACVAFTTDRAVIRAIDSFFVGLLLFLGITITIGWFEVNSSYNEMLETPARIEEMKAEARTPEEVNMVNIEIREYNEAIAQFHTEHLGKERSEKQEQVFKLKPIEEMPVK